MKKIKPIIIFLVLLLIFVIIESQTKIIRRLYDNILYDNQNHYLPCSKLPDEAFVNDVLAVHQDIIQEILEVDPGNTGYEVDTITCPGKADLIIWYASHRDRVAIQKILIDNSFFGVPLRLQNR